MTLQLSKTLDLKSRYYYIVSNKRLNVYKFCMNVIVFNSRGSKNLLWKSMNHKICLEVTFRYTNFHKTDTDRSVSWYGDPVRLPRVSSGLNPYPYNSYRNPGN